MRAIANRFRNMRFSARVVAAGLVPLVVVTGVVVMQARADVQHQDASKAKSKAAAAAAALDQLFTEWRSEMNLASHDKLLQDWYTDPASRSQHQSELNARVVAIASIYPDLIDEVCFIDGQGPEQAREVRGKPAATADLSPDESGNPFFASTMALAENQVHQHQPYVSPDSGRWVISNSSPVFVGGKPKALLHFETSLEGVRTRLAKIIGSDARMRVVTADGHIVIDTGSKEPIGHAAFQTVTQAGGLPGVVASVPVQRNETNQNRWLVVTAVPTTSIISWSRALQLALALGIAIGILLVFARRISKALTRPVEDMAATADALANGDLTSRVPVQSDDEVGIMGRAINNAADRLDTAIGEIAGETTALATAAEELNAVSSTMAETAEHSSQAATRISHEVRSVQEVLTDLAEQSTIMNQSMTDIVAQSQDASAVAESANNAAAEANDAVRRLEESSNEIGEVVKLIESIAAQTNLLALNATIEAARAGESGKGFAVVATEVKSLAQSTGDATSSIGARIEAIRTDTSAVISAIDEMRVVLEQVRDTQQSISAAAGEQAAVTAIVRQSTETAGTAAAAIGSEIDSVVASVQETAVGADQNRHVSSELAEMASRLAVLTGRFQHTS